MIFNTSSNTPSWYTLLYII